MGEKRVRDYKVMSKLGEGGMGQVWQVEHVHLHRRFALKMLNPQLRDHQEFTRQFAVEARSQASLDHPNIVRVTDFFVEKGRYFMISELVDGYTLEEFLRRRGALPQKEALAIMKPILAALNHAHANGIIHRDIKPGNIMISKDKQVKVTDFSLASAAGLARETNKRLVGSPHHMSPEQIRNPAVMDHRVDVYAAGILLFQMLAGRLPFRGETLKEVWTRHLKEPVPDLIKIAPEVSPKLAGIVRKALAKKTEHRFSGCGEFLSFIEEMEEAQPEVLVWSNDKEDLFRFAGKAPADDSGFDFSGFESGGEWDEPEFEIPDGNMVRTDSDKAEAVKPPPDLKIGPGKHLALGAGALIFAFILSGASLQPVPFMPETTINFLLNGVERTFAYSVSLYLFCIGAGTVYIAYFARRAHLALPGVMMSVIANFVMVLFIVNLTFSLVLPSFLKVLVMQGVIQLNMDRGAGLVLTGSDAVTAVIAWYMILLLCVVCSQLGNRLLAGLLSCIDFAR